MKPSAQSIRASIRARQLRAGYKAQGLRGLLGLGTDVAQAPSSSIQMTTDPGAYITPSPSAPANAQPAPAVVTAPTVTTTITATVPTQAPDGSMAPLVPVVTTAAAPKKWYSFLETTKPDGTVTGPLGLSWTIWIVGGGAAALYFANRPENIETTPNTRRRKKARRNRRRH